MRIRGYGIEIDLPDGWEGLIYRRDGGHPMLHAGDFPLPAGDGDFGPRSIGAMSPNGVFVALAEYDPALGGVGLFSPASTPWPFRPADPSRRTMERPRPDRAGLQRFFTVKGRAFSLYLVIGTAGGASDPIKRANTVLSTVRILPLGREASWA